MTPAWPSVEKFRFLQVQARHFLQTNSLGAQLDFVAINRLRLAMFIFNNLWRKIDKVSNRELNNVRLANKSQAERMEPEGTDNPNIPPAFAGLFVGLFVLQPTFCR